MSHTPEPWRAEWQPGQTPNHTYTHCVMYGDDSLCDTLTKADAYRIVACVNALAGVADPAAQVAKWKAMEQLVRGLCPLLRGLAGQAEDHDDQIHAEYGVPLENWAGQLEAALAAKGGE